MPKKAKLLPHLRNEELKQKYSLTPDHVESRRWHLLWKVSMGWTIKNSAVAVGINYDYAKEILKKYNSSGEEGVKNGKNQSQGSPRGKKSLLNSKQLEKLAQALKSRPEDGGIWTRPKVARWIEGENSIEKVWNQRGWDYLKKLRYSCQSPRPKHSHGDEVEQAKFIKNWP